MSARVPRREPARFPWFLVTGLLLGLGLGLGFAWLVSPVTYQDASPAMLEPAMKNYYRRLVMMAYQSNHDTGRASARLALLAEADPAAALEAQAKNAAGNGSSGADEARALNELAQALRSTPQGNVEPAAPTSSPAATQTSRATEALRTVVSAGTELPATLQPSATATFTPEVTFTPRPSQTASPTAGAPYALVEKQPVCSATLPGGLLQVQVEDSAGQAVPGVMITVLWSNNGQDRFYTGLAPEISPGYADYHMTAGVVYSLRVGENGETVENLTSEECTRADGSKTPGGIKLRFRQP